MSKTQEAIKLVGQGMTPHAAALEAGIKPPTLYAALKVLKVKTARYKEDKIKIDCPCCGRPLEEKPQ